MRGAGCEEHDESETRGTRHAARIAVAGAGRNVPLPDAPQFCQDDRVVASRRLFLGFALAACTPEPASSQEILQTVQEVVDQGRALAIENDVVALAANVDPDGDPAELRDDVAALLADVACAVVTLDEDPADLRVEFADGCVVHGRGLSGRLVATYERPVDDLLVTLNLQELTRAGTTLSGVTRISWGIDGTQRIVGELRLDAAAPDSDAPGRQIEIQTDRIQRMHRGVRQVDGWHRWQTLMGKWKAELAGWELAPDTTLPLRGLTVVDTPFEHDVVLDHRDAGEGSIELRANGGRADRVFMIAADGTITDLGED